MSAVDFTHQAAEALRQATQAADKRLATLRAELALHGFEVRVLPGPAYLVAKWNLSKTLESVDALAAFAAQVGGRRA